jgi:hypothetical protein
MEIDLQALSTNWQQTKEVVTQHCNRLAEVSMQLGDVLKGGPVSDHPSAVNKRAAETAITSLAESHVDALFSTAIEMFSPAGVRVDIDRKKILHGLGYSHLRDYDPAVLWKALEAQIGGGKGEEKAYQQVAKTLHSNFRIWEDDQVKTVAGAVCLNVRVVLDSFDKKYGRNKLHYGSSDTLNKTMQALSAFAKWASRPALAADLEKHPFHYFNHEVESRKRYPFGDRELEVISYTNRFEFRVNPELASELQVFIGTFGPVKAEAEA